MSIEQELVALQKKAEQDAEDSQQEEVQEVQPFQYYLRPEVTFKIVTTKWGIVTIIAGACYLYEIIWTISGVNNYTDITRLNLCGSAKAQFASDPTSEAALAAASAIYDFPILLVTYWHMIEWIRWTTLLTVALVDANLIPFFYFLSLVIPFGFIISIVAVIMRSSGDLSACATEQPERARYLQLQLVCFFLYFIVAFAQVWLFKIKGVDWCHQQWLDDGEDEDED